MTKDTEALREALKDMCAAMEYWAGCDEGCSEDEAASEIMSGGGAWPATSYEQSRALIAALTTPATVDPVAGEEARLSRVEPVARAGIVARNAWDALRLVGGKFWRELPDDMQTLAICSARDGYELGRDNALAALQGPAA